MLIERKDTGNVALGQYLAAQRLARGLSFRQMGLRIGRAASTIQSWELGRRLPGLDELYVLANVLQIDVQELIALATTPVKVLEKQLKTAEERYRKVTHAKAPSAQRTVASREVVFLRNLIAGKQKEENAPAGATSLRAVPVAGEIRAGRYRVVDEDIQGYTGVPGGLEVDYALTVEGDSMVGAGIMPGDQVLVRKSGLAEPGRTVVALLGGHEVTVKHLVEENGRHVLRSNNPDRGYPDIPLGPGDRILGEVQRIVRRPGPPPKRTGEAP